MLYGTLVTQISALTEVSEEDVRRVLSSLPEVVMACAEGEQVQTPFGAFRIIRRKLKRVRAPSGQWAHAPERLQARLRPGKRLQKTDLEAPSEPRNSLPDFLEEENLTD